ncbi:MULTISPECIES: pyridoxamine 5'-phosphate oxidase family protein [unclassified Streptomyces]|uniref:helix-turn-helix domain-containing protein n=1 Tax=unclassified Streptomyces TaxID=2593676 RepID=UPI002DDBD225|nr:MULTISPECIES: pyridoxamine 5'-phosphate oxidase family protein [unclassified Streptomyces]WSE00627.1 pyridoxamine 5'-phosphate oxidase family protein [Streptomyces sp. NBC_01474]
MSERATPHAEAVPTGRAQSDIGRRIAQRREELGLTREETAARAGTAPGYIQYLEEKSTAMPGMGVLIRLADALDMRLSALRGGDAELTPGMGRAARHPELIELSVEECWARLSTHGVGRVAVDGPAGPFVVPLNYSVVDGMIAYRTAPDATPATAVGTHVAFEVDQIDEALSQGWSVLLQGPARAVSDADTVRRLNALAYSEPWAGGERDMWVCIDPDSVSGRRIVVRREG